MKKLMRSKSMLLGGQDTLRRRMVWLAWLAMGGWACLLSACTSLQPKPDVDQVNLPEHWSATSGLIVAHGGSAAELVNWWGRFQDPVLQQWITAAQLQSPTLESARAAILKVRANRQEAVGALLPSVSAVAGSSKSGGHNTTHGTTSSLGLQASWEVGLWGENTMNYQGVAATLEATKAQWHQARVLIASEVGKNYFALHYCLRQRDIAQKDVASRQQTLKNVAATERVGLTAPATTSLAEASVASSKNQFIQYDSQCQNLIKTLVAQTGVVESKFSEQLQQSKQNFAQLKTLDHLLTVNKVPATVIRQRPDVYIAQRQWLTAASDVGIARAALLPSVQFTGTISRDLSDGISFGDNLNTWKIGPLQVSLPLFNRSALYAYSDAAVASYDAADKNYRQSIRDAVRDVEQSLISLSSSKDRLAEAEAAAAGYQKSFAAFEAQFRVGLVSLSDLEDARRSKLSADNTLVSLQLERANAWINLYSALGGGFDPAVDYPELISSNIANSGNIANISNTNSSNITNITNITNNANSKGK